MRGVPAGSIAASVKGEELILLPDRAVYWPALSTLLIADPHFGKAATFRAAGIRVPEATTATTLTRLDVLIASTSARRLVFLGDFLHAREGRHPATLDALAGWRTAHESLDMVLVRGNHDRRAGDPPPALRMACVDAPHVEGPFAFAHHPATVRGAYVLAGHVHPGARLHGIAHERVRLPCFWFGADSAVLPAFGEFTGLADVQPKIEDKIWVTTGHEIIAVSASSSGRHARAD
ncbi:MAG: ligase-associated DNA damage response endonuclease PdeM [Gemmatimonadota bacterium]